MTIDSRKLTRFAKTLRGRRIGVAGDFMLDRYVWGSATRLSPEAPVPVVDFVNESQVLGGAGNVATNLAALGATVFPFGVVGEDEEGAQSVRSWKRREWRRREWWRTRRASTTVKTRIVARHQQIVRVDRERREPLSRALEDRLVRAIKAALAASRRAGVSDYDKGVVTDSLADRVLDRVPSPRRARAGQAEDVAIVRLSRRDSDCVQCQGSRIFCDALARRR